MEDWGVLDQLKTSPSSTNPPPPPLPQGISNFWTWTQHKKPQEADRIILLFVLLAGYCTSSLLTKNICSSHHHISATKHLPTRQTANYHMNTSIWRLILRGAVLHEIPFEYVMPYLNKSREQTVTTAHQSARERIRVHDSASEFTTAHQSSRQRIRVHDSASEFTTAHQSARQRMRICDWTGSDFHALSSRWLIEATVYNNQPHLH